MSPRLLSVLIGFLILGSALGSRAWADDPRAEARTHYQAGVKFYGGADYKSAIREFSAAQQLAPADLNNYNLALCYDKLGDAEPAMQYYRAYLDKVPGTDKRAEIEASVSRLEAASKSAASKRAEETRKADEARKAEEAKAEGARRADEARKAEEARQQEEARRADEARRLRDQPSGPVGPVGPPVGGIGAAPPVPTPAASTGDRQLDRVSQIDINQIRNQRLGGAGGGMLPPTAANPQPPGPNAPPQNLSTNAGAQGLPPTAAAGTNGAPPVGAPTDQPQPVAEPLYKKWWFWAVVAVSAYVVYEIATSNSNNSATGRELPLNRPGHSVPDSGWTLMRW